MQLQQIRTFVTVANLGHLTKAAEALHLTQPALSGQLKNLEDRLKVKLLTRTATGMALTPAGRELLPKAERILLAVEDMKSTAKLLEGSLSGKLRIGVLMIDPDFLKLGVLMSGMAERHKDIVVDLEVSGVQRCINGVENGTLDGAFFVGTVPHRRLSAMTLHQLNYRVIAPADWAPKLRNAIWGNLALMPWIRAPKPSAHYEMVASMFRHASIEPIRIFEADHESVVVSLVKAGVGLSVIRDDLAFQAAARGEVMVWEHAPAVQLPLSFIHHIDRSQDPMLLAFKAFLEEIWSTSPQAQPGPPG